MGAVIPMIQTRHAKAQGTFAAVYIAAERMGCSVDLALRVARNAKQRVLEGDASPARVVADSTATLRTEAPKVLA